MAEKTGIVVLVQLVKHICRLLATWEKPIKAVIDAAVGSGAITGAQRDIVFSFLALAGDACNVLKIVTGY